MAPQTFSKKSVSEKDLRDLRGKVALVTGGNTGIGYATVQFLVRKGAKVYIAGRSEERIFTAITQLESEGIEDGSLHTLIVDLCDPRTTKKAAENFLAKETRLDILVNNAAIGASGPYHLTKDGLLDIMTTNHISHFALTEALLPILKSTAAEDDSDVRIVNVTSMAHDRAHPESFVGKENLNRNYGNSFNGYLDTYGLSKLANILHIKELQRRLDASDNDIVCIAVHPGPVATRGADQFLLSVPYLGRLLSNFIGPLVFKPWRIGAMSSAFAAAGVEVKDDKAQFKGAYFVPVAKVSQPSKEALSGKLAKELWETTEVVLKTLGV